MVAASDGMAKNSWFRIIGLIIGLRASYIDMDRWVANT